MTKSDLARRIYQKHGGITLKESKNIVDLLFDIISTSLKESNHLVISGLGTFRVVLRKEKVGRIIKEGKAILVPKKKSIKFIPARKRKMEIVDD